MVAIFYELLDFFGVTTDLITFSDCLVWIVSVAFAIGLFMFVMNIFRAFLVSMPKWTKL